MQDNPRVIDVMALTETEGLVFACQLDGKGGGTLTDWEGVTSWTDVDTPIWIHFDRASPRVQEWLRAESGLTPITIDALLAEETRPRTFKGKRGTIAILRGVNTNSEENPEDMVAIRIWSDGKRVISLRHRRLMTPRAVLATLLQDHTGPTTASELFERLVSRLIERMGSVVDAFDDALDEIEETIGTADASDALQELGKTRQDAVILRRYIAPQREAVATLYQEPPDWMDETSRLRLRETANRLLQYIETLDAARERAVVLKDDIANRMSETMNKNMYVLSIVAAIFLPLGFITGLLGINVGGMPGVDSSTGFWVTCAAIGVLLVIELAIFRMLKWI